MTCNGDHAMVFEGYRQHLWAVARRILRDQQDAEDAVQDAWLRFSTANPDQIENPGGWLTTCTTRLCLDRLRRRSPTPVDLEADLLDDRSRSVEDAALLVVEVEAALGVALEQLSPAQRIALILHDVFAMPFDSIGEILSTSSESARRQASRARAKLRASGVQAQTSENHADVVDAFRVAASNGDVDALVTVLHPDVIRTADPQALPSGTPLVLRGRQNVIREAKVMAANARRSQQVRLGDHPALLVGSRQAPELILTFAFTDGQISSYDVCADPHALEALLIH